MTREEIKAEQAELQIQRLAINKRSSELKALLMALPRKTLTKKVQVKRGEIWARTYASAKEAAWYENNLTNDHQMISKCCRGEMRYAHGKEFRYAPENE